MLNVSRLIKEIREGLATGRPSEAVENLASEYARATQEACQRLESCAAMIGKGSEYQALQLAETEPALLDLIGVLSFAEMRAWSEFCAAQGLPVAERFDGKAVQALDQLYAKGITPNHPLYKDYRSAVTSRDETNALRIIRSIAHLNPEDADAKKELARWENKLFQHKMQDLKAALERGEEEPILHELEELERLGGQAKFGDSPGIASAMEIRRQAARREAKVRCHTLVESLAEERQAGAWRMVGDLLARITGLQAEHGFQLAEPEAGVCAEMQRYFEEQRAAAADTARFHEALANLGALTDQIDNRLLTRSTLTLSETENLYLGFNRRWKETERFGRAVPDEVTQRVSLAAAGLRTELERLQKRRRAALIMAAAVALAVLGGAGWFALRAYRVQDYARQLAVLRQSGQVEAVEKMIRHLRSDQPALADRPLLRASLDDLDKWTRDERARQMKAEALLSDLEKAAATDFQDSDPMATGNQLATAGELAAKLPTGLRATDSDRFAVVRNKFETHLASIREKLVTGADEELTALETIVGEKLGHDQTRPVIAAALAQCEPRLKALEERAHPALKALELPPAEQERAAVIRKRMELFQDELAVQKNVSDSLLQARTLDAYQQALAGFKESRLAQDPEVNEARKILAVFPKADDILESLLMPGDPVGWAAAKADSSGDAFLPDNVQSEISKFLALKDDAFLSDIWIVTLVDYNRGSARRELYSHEELKKEGPRLIGDAESTTWTGLVFDPTLHKDYPVFARFTVSSNTTKYGFNGTGKITDGRLTPESQCLLRLDLNRMTNASGDKFERPLLRVFDELAHDKEADAVFKAYIMQQLAAIMDLRPTAWGMEYCPSLRADLARLSELCGDASLHSQDWLIAGRRAQFSPKLGPFFAELQSREYFDEARIYRRILRAALRAGLQFGGYLDGELQPHPLAETAAGSGLWALLAEGAGVGRYELPGTDGKLPQKFAPYSPLFFIPMDPHAAVTEATQAAGTRSKVKLPAIPFLHQ
jgi:hypothetical protein